MSSKVRYSKNVPLEQILLNKKGSTVAISLMLAFDLERAATCSPATYQVGPEL